MELQNLLSKVQLIAEEAGKIILQIYQESDYQIRHKLDNTPVTKADMAAHCYIQKSLYDFIPGLPILSEESSAISWNERAHWNSYWLIDPLDGTREFIKKNDEFTVNIALIDNHEPILGVVYAPVFSTIYYAARGVGVFKKESGGADFPIHVRTAPDVPVIAGSRSHPGEYLSCFLDNIGSYHLMTKGSSLKTCLVAEGKADIYPRLGLTSEWDTAAAQCVLELAGGSIQDLNGNRLLYNYKESLLNPLFLAFGDASKNWLSYLPAALKAE